MTKQKLFRMVVFGTLLVALGWINGRMLTYESILKDGKAVYVPLDTEDAARLIENKVMHMRYDNNILPPQVRMEAPLAGTMIVRANANGVVEFVRLDDQTPLAEGHMKLDYRLRWTPGLGLSATAPNLFVGAAKIGVPEGRKADYAKARYGIVKLGVKGNALLTGLANKKHRPIVTWDAGEVEFGS